MLRNDAGTVECERALNVSASGRCLLDEAQDGFFVTVAVNTVAKSASHLMVCAMTAAFLEFSKSCGNDLSAPMPEFGFPGLSPGDRWCLCAPRWREALEAGCAPRVVLRATHEGALDYCSLPDLKRLAVDLA